MMVRLATVGEAELRDVFDEAWRSQASRKLLAEFDQAVSSAPRDRITPEGSP